jgi:hypothetical protein
LSVVAPLELCVASLLDVDEAEEDVVALLLALLEEEESAC